MGKQMGKQLNMEVTWENYEHYCVQPVFEYQHWDEVMGKIIQSPHW